MKVNMQSITYAKQFIMHIKTKSITIRNLHVFQNSYKKKMRKISERTKQELWTINIDSQENRECQPLRTYAILLTVRLTAETVTRWLQNSDNHL